MAWQSAEPPREGISALVSCGRMKMSRVLTEHNLVLASSCLALELVGHSVTMQARDVVGRDWREKEMGIAEIHVAVTVGRTRWWKEGALEQDGLGHSPAGSQPRDAINSCLASVILQYILKLLQSRGNARGAGVYADAHADIGVQYLWI